MYKANDGFVKTFKNLCYVIAKSFLDEALQGLRLWQKNDLEVGMYSAVFVYLNS